MSQRLIPARGSQLYTSSVEEAVVHWRTRPKGADVTSGSNLGQDKTCILHSILLPYFSLRLSRIARVTISKLLGLYRPALPVIIASHLCRPSRMLEKAWTKFPPCARTRCIGASSLNGPRRPTVCNVPVSPARLPRPQRRDMAYFRQLRDISRAQMRTSPVMFPVAATMYESPRSMSWYLFSI